MLSTWDGAGADRNQIFGAVGHNPAVAGVVVAVEPVHIFHGYAGIFAGLFVRAEEAGLSRRPSMAMLEMVIREATLMASTVEPVISSAL